MYTASIYAAFASLLHNKHSTLVIFFSLVAMVYLFIVSCWPSLINVICSMQVNQRAVMFSYGSGLSSTMFSFKLQEGQHPFSLTNIAAVLNVSEKLKARHVVCPYSIFLHNLFCASLSSSVELYFSLCFCVLFHYISFSSQFLMYKTLWTS